MADDNRGENVFRIEAEAEAAARKLAKEGERGLTNKCPECGALGSLEEHEDGQMRCIDCDVVVGAASRLGGLGRK